MADTIDVLQGTYVAADAAVIGFLPVQPYARRVTQIVIQGPARSTFKMYRGARITPTMQITATPTGGGQDNTYDSTTDGAPTLIGPGEQVMGVWSGGATTTGSTGTATVRSIY
jgi:hypothetical protein